jgi:hypothetical protein
MVPELSPAEALDAIGALLALRAGASSLDILHEFLHLRQDCLRSRAALGRSESARAAMCTLLRTVMSTVDSLSHVFVAQKSGCHDGLRQFVESTASDTAEPSVLLLGESFWYFCLFSFYCFNSFSQ